MSVRPNLVFVLLLAASATLTACSGSLSGSPSTTETPVSPAEMCILGQNVFSRIQELDQTKPDYLAKLKDTIKNFGTQAPPEIYDDLKAWTDYVKQVDSPAQLDPLPNDLQVSTKRVDDWWQANCKRPFGS